MLTRPKEGIWGHLTIKVSPEDVEALKQYRYDKYFSFIPVLIDIDTMQRQTNAKVDENKQQVKVEIDFTTWDDIKKGKKLLVNLPNGKSYNESLVGSGAALKTLEKTSQ